ncbi:MAG TPA: hypothetical protein VM759_07575, partial [Longimicrobium sp.]|nr:hypothetical protein [Longimicrobium sp.]
NVHFSMKAFMQNPDSLNERLMRGPYRNRALVPATPWLGGRVLSAPEVTATRAASDGTVAVRMQPAAGDEPMWWIVRVRRGTEWSVDVVPGGQREYQPAAGQSPVDLFVVTPVDRLGTEGTPAYLRP